MGKEEKRSGGTRAAAGGILCGERLTTLRPAPSHRIQGEREEQWRKRRGTRASICSTMATPAIQTAAAAAAAAAATAILHTDSVIIYLCYSTIWVDLFPSSLPQFCPTPVLHVLFAPRRCQLPDQSLPTSHSPAVATDLARQTASTSNRRYGAGWRREKTRQRKWRGRRHLRTMAARSVALTARVAFTPCSIEPASERGCWPVAAKGWELALDSGPN